jgi:hypothetical protein
MNHYPDKKSPIQGYPYFRDVRKIAMKVFSSIYCLFMTKLILAILILGFVLSMIMHGRHMAKGKECLLLKAEMDIIDPDHGSFFKEFGRTSNNTILSAFVHDLEHFQKWEYEWNHKMILNNDFKGSYHHV